MEKVAIGFPQCKDLSSLECRRMVSSNPMLTLLPARPSAMLYVQMSSFVKHKMFKWVKRKIFFQQSPQL